MVWRSEYRGSKHRYRIQRSLLKIPGAPPGVVIPACYWFSRALVSNWDLRSLRREGGGGGVVNAYGTLFLPASAKVSRSRV